MLTFEYRPIAAHALQLAGSRIVAIIGVLCTAKAVAIDNTEKRVWRAILTLLRIFMSNASRRMAALTFSKRHGSGSGERNGSRIDSRKCPLWVKSRYSHCTSPCPLWARSGRKMHHAGHVSSDSVKCVCLFEQPHGLGHVVATVRFTPKDRTSAECIWNVR